MSAGAQIADSVTALVGIAAVIVIISRFVRIARLNSPTAEAASTAHTPRRPLWGPARRLEKLHENTAILRSETELLISTGEQLQARHNLDRLKTELEPQATARRQPLATQPSLTVPEIRAVLAAIELPPELRMTILELLEATANEKTQR